MAEQTGAQDVLSRLLEDPEVLAAGQPSEQAEEAMGGTSGDALPFSLPPELLGKLPALLSTLGPVMNGKDTGVKDEKTALLLALKPYMSPQRCDAIDKLIMFGRLGQIMQQLR